MRDVSYRFFVGSVCVIGNVSGVMGVVGIGWMTKV